MKRLSPDQVHALKVAELGLDPSAIDLTAPEAIASALRRAAGLMCPCSASKLTRSILRSLDGLMADRDATGELVETILEAIVAHGDLLEHRDVAAEGAQQRGVLLYTAPPSFVARRSGAALLLGVAPDGLSPLPRDLEDRVDYVNHVRYLSANSAEGVRETLLQFGFVELSFEQWLSAPAATSAAQHLARMDAVLSAAESSIDIPGLLVLDPTRPVRYYRGRWTEPRKHTGRFVGRRRQAYGADLWCYIELRDGNPVRFIDLPLSDNDRGCDEAWRLQLAIDAQRGEPQRFRVGRGPAGHCLIEFFSPMPMWARRRWDAFGKPVTKSGCLFAYVFNGAEVNEELRFISATLWAAEGVDGRANQEVL